VLQPAEVNTAFPAAALPPLEGVVLVIDVDEESVDDAAVVEGRDDPPTVTVCSTVWGGLPSDV
jgi:hypothetical protein